MNNNISLLKFFCGSAVGAALDFCVSALCALLGAGLFSASLAGFCSSVFVTYFIHLRWTFLLKQQAAMSVRLLKFIFSSMLTIVVRITCIYVCEQFFDISVFTTKYAILIGSIGLSFFVNYFASSFWVFSLGR